MKKIVNQVLKNALGVLVFASLLLSVDSNATDQFGAATTTEDSSIESILPEFNNDDEEEEFATSVREFYGTQPNVCGSVESLEKLLEYTSLPMVSPLCFIQLFARNVLNLENGENILNEGLIFQDNRKASVEANIRGRFLGVYFHMQGYIRNAIDKLKAAKALDSSDEEIFQEHLLNEKFEGLEKDDFTKNMSATEATQLKEQYFRILFQLNTLVIKAVRREEEAK